MPLHPKAKPPLAPSVLSNPVINGLRAARDFMTGDPADDMMGTVSPMATPLVSIFKDKAARKVGTAAFRKEAHGINYNLGKAANWFAERYPRVAAHMDIGDAARFHDPSTTEATAAAAGISPGRVTERVPVIITKRGAAVSNDIPGKAREYLTHEGTHVAQALGNKDMTKLYDIGEEAVGYEGNPLERGAFRRGYAAKEGLSQALERPNMPHESNIRHKPETAARLFKYLSDMAPEEVEGTPALLELRRIIKERGW